MPHIIIKMYPGRTQAQQEKLVRNIVSNVVEIADCEERSVSVAIEEIDPDSWAETVYKPDILQARGRLVKAPGYNPFEPGESRESATHKLMEYVRSAARTAAADDPAGAFNAMSWLDLELEDNPGQFDPYFGTPWEQLDDAQRQKRAAAVRSVL